MVIIPRTSSFLKSGAIVPTEDELNVIIHALIEHEQHCGPVSAKRVGELIDSLKEYQKKEELTPLFHFGEMG